MFSLVDACWIVLLSLCLDIWGHLLSDVLGCLGWQDIAAFSGCGSCLICVIVVLFPLVVSFSINWF